MTPAVLLAFCCIGHAADHSVADTRETLAKWVEARQMISRLKAEWQEDKETLNSTISLFEGQRERLQDKLKQVGGANDQVKKETTENQAELDRQMAALKKVETLVAGFEAKLKGQTKNYPPSLVGDATVADFIDRIPEDPKDTKLSVIERFQNLIVLIKAVQEFNSELHLRKETLQNGEQEVPVKTLYLGLGQAWFVDDSGGFAGTGGPSPEGWKWKPEAKIAPQIQQAIAVYEKSQPAAYVALPVEVK